MRVMQGVFRWARPRCCLRPPLRRSFAHRLRSCLPPLRSDAARLKRAHRSVPHRLSRRGSTNTNNIAATPPARRGPAFADQTIRSIKLYIARFTGTFHARPIRRGAVACAPRQAEDPSRTFRPFAALHQSSARGIRDRRRTWARGPFMTHRRSSGAGSFRFKGPLQEHGIVVTI
jgi:hypothetical protein